jgi:deoxyribonuclease-4
MDKYNVPVKLIHYNDSKGECGCKKDRHAPIGQGFIGLESLNATLTYAVKKNIPLLTE